MNGVGVEDGYEHETSLLIDGSMPRRKAVISQPDDGALLVLIVVAMNIADSVLWPWIEDACVALMLPLPTFGRCDHLFAFPTRGNEGHSLTNADDSEMSSKVKSLSESLRFCFDCFLQASVGLFLCFILCY